MISFIMVVSSILANFMFSFLLARTALILMFLGPFMKMDLFWVSMVMEFLNLSVSWRLMIWLV